MDGVGPWIAGVGMALLALVGLSMASRAVDTPFYLFGLALFALGVGCVFGLIARGTAHHPPVRRAAEGTSREGQP